MDSPDDVTGPINLGNPGEFTILELAEPIIALTGSNSKIVFRPLPADDPIAAPARHRAAARAARLGAGVPLEEGLQRTVAYFEALLTERGRISARGG